MNLRNTNLQYYEEKTIKRYRGYYKQLDKLDRERARDYIAFSQFLQSLVTDLFTKYSDSEGKLPYSRTKQNLNQVELMNYRRELQRLRQNLTQENHLQEVDLLLSQNSVDRLNSILNLAKVALFSVAEDDSKALSDFLVGNYLDNFYKSTYELSKGLGIGLPIDRLTEEEVINKISLPWADSTFQEYIEDSKARLQVDIRKTLTRGLNDELQLLSILKLLDRKVDKGFKNQKLINESELSHNLNESKEESSLKSSISESYILIATLDSRTSLTCRNIDGKVFKYADKRVGKNYPPFHYNCRTAISDYFSKEDLEGITRIARDPLTNQNYYVSADITYEEWFNNYVR